MNKDNPWKDMAEAMQSMQVEQREHQHKFTIPVEHTLSYRYRYENAEWVDENPEPTRPANYSKVTKLKCETCSEEVVRE